MSFWNTDKLVLKQSQQKLIEPFESQFAKQGAYELSLGPEAFITSEPNATKQVLAAGEQLSIPPGQFGLLLTEEVVTIPDDAIGFISVRFTIKRRGLVNVSGFHVDPGFSGRLKFAVYNAGSQPIVVSRGERVFMIWFSDMSASTPDPYQGQGSGQNEITSQDVMFIQGEVASPAVLKKQIDSLEKEMSMIKLILIGLFLAAAGAFFKSCLDNKPALPTAQSPPVVNLPTDNSRSNEVSPTSTPIQASTSPSNKPQIRPTKK